MPLYQSALAKDIFKDQIIIVTGGGSGIGGVLLMNWLP